MAWTGCSPIEIDPEKVSGAPVFKGTRLPVETITDNIDACLDEGLSLDEAIFKTLENFPSTPKGAEGIRSVWNTAQPSYSGEDDVFIGLENDPLPLYLSFPEGICVCLIALLPKSSDSLERDAMAFLQPLLF